MHINNFSVFRFLSVWYQASVSLSLAYRSFTITKCTASPRLQSSPALQPRRGGSLMQLGWSAKKNLFYFAMFSLHMTFCEWWWREWAQVVQNVHNKWWVTAAWFIAVLFQRGSLFLLSGPVFNLFSPLLGSYYKFFSLFLHCFSLPLGASRGAGKLLRIICRTLQTEPDQRWNTKINLI